MFGIKLGPAVLFFLTQGGGGVLILGELPRAENGDGDGRNPACPGELEFFARRVGEALAALRAGCEVRFVSEATECADGFHGLQECKDQNAERDSVVAEGVEGMGLDVAEEPL